MSWFYDILTYISVLISNECRCDAQWDNLDAKDTGQWAHRHTEAVFEALGSKEMWDDYGIINDIMVSSHHMLISSRLMQITFSAIHSWISVGGYS